MSQRKAYGKWQDTLPAPTRPIDEIEGEPAGLITTALVVGTAVAGTAALVAGVCLVASMLARNGLVMPW